MYGVQIIYSEYRVRYYVWTKYMMPKKGKKAQAYKLWPSTARLPCSHPSLPSLVSRLRISGITVDPAKVDSGWGKREPCKLISEISKRAPARCMQN